MDAGGHAQPLPEDPIGFIPPRENGGDDDAERSCFVPLKSPQGLFMQDIHPVEDTTPRRRSARLTQTSTSLRPLNLRITLPQTEQAVEETDPGNDTADINQDVEDGEHQPSVFSQSDRHPYQSLRRY
jgi:hypothetical protein